MEPSLTPVPTITILSPSNGRASETLITELQLTKPGSTSYKREPEALDKEKASKIARLSSESGQKYEKENVDPRRFLPPGLNIRRGSAPVTASLTRTDDNANSAGGVLRTTTVGLPRRGSMPADVSQHGTNYLYTYVNLFKLIFIFLQQQIWKTMKIQKHIAVFQM